MNRASKDKTASRYLLYVDGELEDEYNNILDAAKAADEQPSDGSDRIIEIFERVKHGVLKTKVEWAK